MNLLAFDTSTEALSIALTGSGEPLLHAGAGGAQASASLIPAILALLERGGLVLHDLDAIVFGCGPGSFTGLRTACSVAQGLALGAGVPVLPVETLMAVAEDARSRMGAHDVLAVLDARMDEVYVARYMHDGQRWLRGSPVRLAAPEAVEVPAGAILAGNAFRAYGNRLPATAAHVAAAPTAAALLRLAPALIAAGEARAADEALPLYVRDKVAQTTAEREAARAAPRQDRMTP
ncbi:MAG: tRNA (adenosine(37)-N6)-threonylcarbamoyltransferase complex dimerization subunit type 1 TsaB [Ramlibacter sp.]